MSDLPKTFEGYRAGGYGYCDDPNSYERCIDACHEHTWDVARAALMAELLEGEEVSDDERLVRALARVAASMGGPADATTVLLEALDRSRASEAALRKRLASLDDGRVHCPDCHEPVAAPCTSWYKDQAALLRKRLAEVEGERDSALAAIDSNTEDLTEYAREQDEVAGSLCALFTALGLEPYLAMEGSGPGDAIRQATRRSEEQRAQLIALREELDEVKRSWSVAKREYVLTNQRLRDERSAERRANERLRKPIDVDALVAELEKRTRERDEALPKIREAAQDGDMHPYLEALLWEAVGILSPGIDPGNGPKKGPADDR